MRSQRKEGGVTAGMSQSGSSITLSQGMSGKCLTNWFRHANMDDMKTPNKSGVVAESVQPVFSLAVLCGVAGERLASGFRCARVVVMNRLAGTPIVRGEADLIWRRASFARARVCDGGVVSLADAQRGLWSGGAVVLSLRLVCFLFAVEWDSARVAAGFGSSNSLLTQAPTNKSQLPASTTTTRHWLLRCLGSDNFSMRESLLLIYLGQTQMAKQTRLNAHT